MIINKLIIVSPFLLTTLFIACGKKNNINPELKISDTNSYFVTNKWGEFSNLYSFDFATNKTNLILSRPASGDPVVFQKYDSLNKIQGIYFAERFSTTKLSRVTYFSSMSKNSGIEHTQFPMNLYNIISVDDNIIGIGYDRGEIIKTDLSLQNTILKSTQISNLEYQDLENPLKSETNVTSLLYAYGKVYLVSIGNYKDKNIKPTIYQLSDDLQTAEKIGGVSDCFNALKQVNVIYKSKLVISCNPYPNTQVAKMNLFLIDVSTIKDRGSPLIKEIISKDRDENGIQQFEIGGISEDKNSIFVTERKKIDNQDWKNSVIISSYWIDLSSPESITINDITRQTPVNSVAGSVTYNYEAKSYLFSCLLDASNSTCIKSKGAVSQSRNAKNSVQIDFGIKGVDEIKFPTPVF
jgi:hypothetical protein